VSFLDNLENNLKALESRDEKDPEARAREAAAREPARLVAMQIAPRAEALRNGLFKDGLLTACPKHRSPPADPLASTLVDGAPPDTGRMVGHPSYTFCGAEGYAVSRPQSAEHLPQT
jgi:hypothetical protein